MLHTPFKERKSGIIPSYRIVKKSGSDALIEDEVNEILSNIEEDVLLSYDNKKKYAVTELPTNFDIPGMSNADAQKHIYFYVLSALRKSHYIPTIDFKGIKSELQKVFIYTKWHNKEDMEMEAYMDKYIQGHTAQNDKEDIQNAEKNAKPIRRRRRKQ